MSQVMVKALAIQIGETCAIKVSLLHRFTFQMLKKLMLANYARSPSLISFVRPGLADPADNKDTIFKQSKLAGAKKLEVAPTI